MEPPGGRRARVPAGAADGEVVISLAAERGPTARADQLLPALPARAQWGREAAARRGQAEQRREGEGKGRLAWPWHGAEKLLGGPTAVHEPIGAVYAPAAGRAGQPRRAVLADVRCALPRAASQPRAAAGPPAGRRCLRRDRHGPGGCPAARGDEHPHPRDGRAVHRADAKDDARQGASVSPALPFFHSLSLPLPPSLSLALTHILQCACTRTHTHTHTCTHKKEGVLSLAQGIVHWKPPPSAVDAARKALDEADTNSYWWARPVVPSPRALQMSVMAQIPTTTDGDPCATQRGRRVGSASGGPDGKDQAGKWPVKLRRHGHEREQPGLHERLPVPAGPERCGPCVLPLLFQSYDGTADGNSAELRTTTDAHVRSPPPP
jgi:hypothetical protein